MSIDDVYEYFESNWSHATRTLGLGHNTYLNWKKIGYIPMATQRKIEKKTKGKLKADVPFKQ